MSKGWYTQVYYQILVVIGQILQLCSAACLRVGSSKVGQSTNKINPVVWKGCMVYLWNGWPYCIWAWLIAKIFVQCVKMRCHKSTCGKNSRFRSSPNIYPWIAVFYFKSLITRSKVSQSTPNSHRVWRRVQCSCVKNLVAIGEKVLSVEY